MVIRGVLTRAARTGQRKKRVVILLSANRSQTIGVLLSHLKVT